MYMLPTPSETYQADGRVMNTQDLAQFDIGHTALSDQSNAIFGKSSIASAFASHATPSGVSLGVVIGLCTEMKVSGLNTNWTVTGMQDVQSASRAVVNPISGDVGALGPTVQPNLPVSLTVRASRPVPAPVRRVSRHEPGEDLFLTTEFGRTATSRSIRHLTSVPRREER